MQRKRILYLMQQSPYLNDRVFEAFDALLVAAAFEQQVSLLFRGAGVAQLLAGQAPQGQRNLAKMLGSLDAYDIEHIYVEEGSLDAAGLAPEDLAVSAQVIPASKIATLLNEQDLVLHD